MAEWSKAHDWKSCVPPKGTEGSNPSLSANMKKHPNGCFFMLMREKGFEPSKREFDKEAKADVSMPVSD